MNQNQVTETQVIVSVLSPVDGCCHPLIDTPDEAIASGALGAGIAIEPLSNRFYAPIDGRITSVARTCHAITIRSESGIEILVHIGVDTVELDGEGFTVSVSEGDTVKAGDLLIRIEDSKVAAHAKSLCTPVVVLDAQTNHLSLHAREGRVKRGTPLFDVVIEPDSDQSQSNESSNRLSQSIVLEMPLGLHARPAAQIADHVRRFNGEIEVRLEEKRANAKSVSSLMALGAKYADRIEIAVSGHGAATLLTSLIDLIRAGAGDPIKPFSTNATRESMSPEINLADLEITGVVASSGLIIGPIHKHTKHIIPIPDRDGTPEETAVKLQSALMGAMRLKQLRASENKDETTTKLLEAHAALIVDPELQRAAFNAVDQGLSAGAAWSKAIDDQSRVFKSSEDPMLIERVSDLDDIKQSVLAELYGGETKSAKDLSGHIVISEDLTPTEFMNLIEAGVVGFCLSDSGTTSHVAILAASQGVPLLVAMGRRVLDIPNDRTAVLDTGSASLDLKADSNRIEDLISKIERRGALLAEAVATIDKPSLMIDGEVITVQINLNTAMDAEKPEAEHVDGCGLLRSEFLFSDRTDPPSEDEQADVYSRIVERFNGRDVTIRTLDIGGDKPVPFLSTSAEANPALGLRGIRTSFAHPELMRDQVRAVIRASTAGAVRIMAPMISDAGEMRRFKAIVADEAKSIGAAAPATGTMIETPSSAVLADQIAREADFFSIGTNDLAQYVLAMDRTHPALARHLDGMHPAVISLIGSVCAAGRRHGVETSVCGGLASDPIAVPILIGLGVRKLSIVSSMIAPIKSIIRQLDLEACESTAREALLDRSASDVRARVQRTWSFLDAWT